MVVGTPTTKVRRPGYSGLVLTAEEYLALPPDGRRYELIDGVVVRSPSPRNTHQLVMLEIVSQLRAFVVERGLGLVLVEADVVLEARPRRRGKVFRPEMHFIRAERVAQLGERTQIAPDVVLEVISPE